VPNTTIPNHQPDSEPRPPIRGGRRPPRTRWSIPAGVLVGAALTAANTVTPALADPGCITATAALTPGSWVSSNIVLDGEQTDGIGSVGFVADGNFSVNITADGLASGGLSLSGSASTAMLIPNDTSSADIAFTIEGPVTGTGALMFVEGALNADMTGTIDVSGADGVGSGANEHPAFANSFSAPWNAQLIPASASCNQAFGHIGGATGPAEGPMWFAHRVNPNFDDQPIEQAAADLIEHAAAVSSQIPMDPTEVRNFVFEALGFDALLAAQNDCGDTPLGSLTPGNPAYDLVHTVLENGMEAMAEAAVAGEYTTFAIIYLTAAWLQSGALGWAGPPGTCLDTDGGSRVAKRTFGLLEDALIARWNALQIEHDNGPAEGHSADDVARARTQIAVAAYQFGMSRLANEVEHS